jgi:hypothetical protein
MPLNTRRPTGKVAFPLLQIDGEEKSGKSYAIAALTGSPRVGRSFLLDLGDGTLDEYGPLGDFELLETNGTFGSVLEQVTLASAVPSDPERPNVIGVDAGTLLWGLLKAKAERRAKSSRRARALLQEDPDAEIDVGMTYWNEVKDDWAQLLHVLKRFPGIGVVSAQGRFVSKVDAEGRPVRGQQEWSTDVEKTTHSWTSAMVRLTRDPREARLVGVRSLHIDIPSGGLILPRENTLEHLIFDILGAGGFGPNTATAPVVGVGAAQAKGRVLAAVKRAASHLTEAEAKDEAARLWAAAGLEGQKEVTEVDLAAAMPVGEKPEEDGPGEPASPPQVPQDGPTGAVAPDPAPEPPEAPAATERPEPPPSHPGPHVLADGSVLTIEGKPVTADEAMAWLGRQLKPAIVTVASQLGVATNGKKEDIAERIAEHWGILTAPFDPPADVAPPVEDQTSEPALPLADPEPLVHAADAPDEPESLVQDIPDGWVEGECYCGQSMIYEVGLYSKTKTHLDRSLDEEHAPDEGF